MIRCIEQLLDADNVAVLRRLAAEHEFVDGRSTAGGLAGRVKQNLQLDGNVQVRDQLRDIVVARLREHDIVRRHAMPERVAAPLLSCYRPGMAYGAHSDNALQDGGRLRTDLSVTVFLSPPEDYEGGELYVSTSYGDIAVKLPPGDAVLYPTGAIHRVAPVLSGERLAAVTWIQSRIRDNGKRELLANLRFVREHLESAEPHSEATLLAGQTYSELLRRWIDR